MKSIAFVSSDKFFSGDPDFTWMQSVVAKALGPKQGGPKDDPGTAVKTDDACGYHPESLTRQRDRAIRHAPVTTAPLDLSLPAYRTVSVRLPCGSRAGSPARCRCGARPPGHAGRSARPPVR